MQHNTRGALLLFLILTIFSCAKVDQIIVDGNTHPTDLTIENTLIENYVNKLYISTIGREPTTLEFDDDFETLREANLSQLSREIVIDKLLEKVEYFNNLFKLESVNILNGVDTSMINERVDIYQLLLTTVTGIDTIYINYELKRMEEFQKALPALNSVNITSTELYMRMINNSFFDEINMGTENFVVAMFQHFLLRYPTDDELKKAKNMVNDQHSTVFFETGNGKDDFISIFFSSNEYYTGQTCILFNRYLFRNPSSEESVNYSVDYINTDDYQSLQRTILSTNEFIGI